MNSRIITASIVVACIALSGCELTSVANGSGIIQDGLRSPSSFSLVSGKEMWAGKSAAGNDAYIVRIEYDAQNGFGATIRDCKFVAYSVKGTKLHWNPQSSIATCESPTFDATTVEAMRKYHFQS